MADGQDQSLYQGTGICKQFFSRLMKNIFTQARVGYEMVPDMYNRGQRNSGQLRKLFQAITVNSL